MMIQEAGVDICNKRVALMMKHFEYRMSLETG